MRLFFGAAILSILLSSLPVQYSEAPTEYILHTLHGEWELGENGNGIYIRAVAECSQAETPYYLRLRVHSNTSGNNHVHVETVGPFFGEHVKEWSFTTSAFPPDPPYDDPDCFSATVEILKKRNDPSGNLVGGASTYLILVDEGEEEE